METDTIINCHIARQPVFNRRKEVFGYELLFRDGNADFFPGIDGDLATAQVLHNSFLNYGFENLTNGKPALINFTENLLLQDLPLLFPRDKVIVEILETIEPTEGILDACRRLIRHGFTLALDDFVFEERYQALVDMAGLIKIDFRAASLESIQDALSSMGRTRARLLAEKVETHAEFEQAVAMGFTLFQGYFFSKPETVSSRDIRANKASLLAVIAEISGDDCNIENLERHFKSDVSLSVKLLQMVNSAFYQRVGNITSLRHALSYLGCRDISRLATIIVISDLAGDKPTELLRQSLLRARFCELLSDHLPVDGDTGTEAFLSGLFANIDAILDLPMENILLQLPLSENIKTALLPGRSPLGDLLTLFMHYEIGRWDAYEGLLEDLNMTERGVTGAYLEAVRWADATLAML